MDFYLSALLSQLTQVQTASVLKGSLITHRQTRVSVRKPLHNWVLKLELSSKVFKCSTTRKTNQKTHKAGLFNERNEKKL